MSLISFVFLSTAIFTCIVLILVLLLFFVQSKIARQGNAKITINDKQEPLNVPVGKTLLSSLSTKDIYLPSACGGSGTCALCKCEVLEGGGDVLSTETGLLSRREQKENVRLACQVKVREDMRIRVPDEIFNIKKYEAVVRSNKSVATFIKELVLEIKGEEKFTFNSGAYIQIDVPEYEVDYKNLHIEEQYRSDWEKYKLLALRAENDEPVFRAYSMANYPAEGNHVILNVRIATPPLKQMSLPPGIASSYIYQLKKGDQVTFSGPFGDFFIKDTKKEMVYIGGGAGMAPMRSHLFHLLKTKKEKERKISYWYGARSKKEMFYAEDFEGLAKESDNFTFHVAMSEPLPEDKWEGPTGFIHQVVYDQYLKNHEEPEEIEYYLCGPPVMIDAVLKMLDSLGVPPEMIAYDSFG